MTRCESFSLIAVLVLAVWMAGCRAGAASVSPADVAGTPHDAGALAAAEGDKEEATMTAEPGTEETGAGVGTPAEEVVRLAREDLAGRLGVALNSVKVVSVEAAEWSDTSLGCPEPGMMYAQVITPGYRVILGADGQTYEYHTDTGSRVVLCRPQGDASGPSTEGIKDNTPWRPVEPVEPNETGPTGRD
jgi:hypothetical protein